MNEVGFFVIEAYDGVFGTWYPTTGRVFDDLEGAREFFRGLRFDQAELLKSYRISRYERAEVIPL